MDETFYLAMDYEFHDFINIENHFLFENSETQGWKLVTQSSNLEHLEIKSRIVLLFLD